MGKKINVTIYNEFYHEQHKEDVAKIYPKGIHQTIADFLMQEAEIGVVTTATLESHEAILTQDCLDQTDVMIWWGHVKHEDVSEQVVERVCERVYAGMGLVVLHSGHASKVFRRLMGTPSQLLRWREADERCRVWTIAQGHPIARGLGESFVVPQEETYGEQFSIPAPDELVFISWFEGGEVFRSGCTYRRGAGNIFYFQNGHETYPIFHQKEVQLVIKNAVRWACPEERHVSYDLGGPNAPALENKKD